MNDAGASRRHVATFGPNLRRLREASGLTQQELAERAGLTPRAISALERGERLRPYPHTIRVLAAALGLTTEQESAFAATARGQVTPSPASPELEEASRRRPTLPAPPSSFIGRERVLAEVVAMIRDPRSRLVTITGPGGVGKTRLALEVARSVGDEFADGVIFVSLAQLTDDALVLPAIGHALGVSGTRPMDIRLAIAAQTQTASLLIVLDNVEHVLEAAPDLADLIDTAPRLGILTTSRAALRVRGEREYALTPLCVPGLDQSASLEAIAQYPAVQLYVTRARKAAPTFELTGDNAGSVAAICRRLDGLPLALELAAARSRLISPAALLARLDRSSLPLLTGGPRDLPARQQTMEAAIGWSYDLLEPEEARLFRLLAVFVGGSTLEAVEAVDARVRDTPLPSILDLLGSLIDKSLVVPEPGLDGEPRFSMLETIHEFATRTLNASGGADAVRREHAAWWLAFAERIEPELFGPGQEFWYDRLDLELGNLRAAFRWAEAVGDQVTAVRLAGALWPFWFSRGNPVEGREWLEWAAGSVASMSASSRLKALTGAGMLAMALQDVPRATARLEAALHVAEASGNQIGLGQALFGLGVVAQDQGDHVMAEARFGTASTAFETAGNAIWAATTLNNLGLVVARRGDAERGLALLEGGLHRHRELGNVAGVALALRFLGQVMRQQGDDTRAAAFFRESLVGWRGAQGWHIAGALEGLAGIAANHGQLEQAARLLGASAAIRETIGVPVEPALRSAHERTIASVREALGAEEFRRAWVSGAAGGTSFAVEEALRNERVDGFSIGRLDDGNPNLPPLVKDG